MMKRILIALAALNLGLFSVTQAQFVVTNNFNASQLAQSLVGTGVTVSNATKNCPNSGTGTFTGGNSTNLGITNGIVLTTGSTANVGTAASNFSGVDNANGSDAQLSAIVSPNAVTDVCALEFDVLVQGNTLTFRYVFASEEYEEYVCSQFNDVFGFFITGPGYNNQNIAIVPGSNPQQAVSIGSVNNGTPGAGYAANGCTSLSNTGFYQNNGASTNLIFDGMTVTLTATVAVVPCQTYRIKLAVADVSDGTWDSGVFIEASSFTSQPITVTPTYDFGLTTAYEGCSGGLFTINMPNLATSSTPITYTVSGTGTNGTDYTTLPGTVFVNPGTSTALVYVDPIIDNLPEGAETVTITINDPCTGLPAGTATINIEDQPFDTVYASRYTVCAPGDQVQLTATGGGTYSWAPPTGLSSTTSATPTATINAPTTYTATITIGNCVNQLSVDIGLSDLTLQALDSADITICPGTTVTIGADADGGSNPITYQWSPPGQVSNPASPVVSVTPTVTTTYNVTATDAAGCVATSSITVSVDTIAQVEFGGDILLCPESAPYILSVPGGPYTTYAWSNGDSTSTIAVSSTDSFSVTVTNSVCTFNSDTIAVIFYQPVQPTLNDTGFCAGSVITLGIADTSYTNVLWSTGSTNDTVLIAAAGTYYYTATDTNGCTIASDTATVTLYATPTANITASEDTLCPSETAVLYANATGATTYSWTGGGTADTLIVTAPGVYIVTASNPSCSVQDTFEVFGFVNPNALIAADTIVCNGDSVVFRLLNGPFQSYVWSNGVAGVDSIITNVPGTYTLTVSDGNCLWTSNSVTLGNFPTPNPTLADTGACTGTPVVLTVEPGLVNIVWSDATNGPTVTVTTNGTYYYTAEDANGCDVASDTVSVTFLAAPTVNATADEDTICAGASTVLRANATGTSLSYNWSPVAGTADTLVVTQGGTYYVTVSNGFCPVVDSVTVNQYPTTPALTNNDTTVCAGQDVVVSVSGTYATYQWNNGAQTPTFTTDTVGSYWVVLTENGCTFNSDTFTLSNFPVVTPALPDTGACTGQSITLTAQAGLTGVVWSTTQTGPSITVTVAGDYSYTATDANGCNVVSDTSTVTFLPAPTVNATADEDTICAGASTVLRANATGTSLSYNWSPVAGTADTLVVTQGGTYYVTVSNGFCPVVDSVTVVQYSTSPVLTNNDTTVCTGQDVVVSVSGTYTTYQWNNGAQTPTFTTDTVGSYWVVLTENGCTFNSDTFTLSNFPATAVVLPDTGACTGQSITLTAQPGLTNVVWSTTQTGSSITVTVAGDYSYTATDANGCNVIPDTSTVTFLPAPTVNLTATDDTFCLGRTTTLNPNAVGTNLTYVWTPNGDTTSTLTVNTAGTYIVTVNNGFCPTSDTITVNQYATIAPTVNADDTVCPGTSVTVSVSGGPYVTYSWFPAGSTPTIQATSPGNYYVVVNDGNCTYTSDTFTLTNFSVATPLATPNTTTVCTGTPVVLSGEAGYTNYLWQPGNLPGQNVTVNSAGTYSYTATDANGCTVTSTTATVTYTAPPSSTINPTAAVLCPGSNGVTLYSPGVAGVTYTWTPGNIVADSIVVTTAATYTLTASVGGNCQTSSSVTVTTGTTPVLNLAPYTASCCTQVVLNPALGAGFTYNWSNGTSADTLLVETTGNDTVFYDLTVTSPDGCTATQTNIAVRIKCINASVTASPDSIVAGTETSQLLVLTGYDDVTFNYTWTPAATLSDSTIANPVASPTEATSYLVTVTDPIDGCVDTASVTVYIKIANKFKMPNAFSPNGDGRNDGFFPYFPGEDLAVTEFRIYNRWGALVHNANAPWDGVFNGAMQPTGTFIYYITVLVPSEDNPNELVETKQTGSFTLLH